MKITKQETCWLLVVIAVLTMVYTNASGSPQQTDAQSPPNIQDPIRQLNLIPEQREKIRAIRQQLSEERAAIGQRLRETNKALQEALDTDNPDEAQLENLIRDVAAAQAAAMRLRILSEVRIRRVLTAEQLATLQRLRQEARLDRRMDGIRRRQEAFDERRRLANPRNNFRPLDPRVVPQRRTRP
ncbi:MAG TPA: periplasmic heavy metal sensor [Pyrinomonadaceae bacterium]|nr:periplasmic heavy metal sensor [Pyrinomonadaceae bacterium]